MDSEGRRLFMTGTGILQGSATEARTPVPEIVTTNSKAAGGAEILGE